MEGEGRTWFHTRMETKNEVAPEPDLDLSDDEKSIADSLVSDIVVTLKKDRGYCAKAFDLPSPSENDLQVSDKVMANLRARTDPMVIYRVWGSASSRFIEKGWTVYLREERVESDSEDADVVRTVIIHHPKMMIPR